MADPRQASPGTIQTLQSQYGNRAVQQQLIQANLRVGPAHDPFEREADAMADRVLRGGPQAPGGGSARGSIQRASAGAGFEAGAQVEERLQALKGQGSAAHYHLCAERAQCNPNPATALGTDIGAAGNYNQRGNGYDDPGGSAPGRTRCR